MSPASHAVTRSRASDVFYSVFSVSAPYPEDVLDFDQAVREPENAVAIALDVIARGERGANHDEFVNIMLAQAVEKTCIGLSAKTPPLPDVSQTSVFVADD